MMKFMLIDNEKWLKHHAHTYKNNWHCNDKKIKIKSYTTDIYVTNLPDVADDKTIHKLVYFFCRICAEPNNLPSGYQTYDYKELIYITE